MQHNQAILRKKATFGSSFLNLKKQWFSLVTFIALTMSLPILTYAGTIVCENGLNISVNEFCEADISEGQILSGATTCPGPFLLVVLDMNGDTITSGSGIVTVPFGYVGQTISITAIDIPTQNFCTTSAIVEDKILPTIVECPTDTILCTDDIDPAVIEQIVVEDNCDMNLQVEFNDILLAPDCTAPPTYIGVIVRQWTVTDNEGNTDGCFQNIFVHRSALSDIEIESPFIVDCENPVTDTSATGVPTINGNPLGENDFCQFHVTWQDQSDELCSPATTQIIRTWTIIDDCTGADTNLTQIILVVDTVAPTIVCPVDLTVGTSTNSNNSTFCGATVNLPTPVITDNCGTATLEVLTTYGQSGTGTHSDVPVGTHTITYIAEDDCGNSDTCQINLTVVDDTPPTPVCDEITSVSLLTDGLAVVPADVFDDGSLDNCSPIFFLASRDGVNFTPEVIFDCNDVGTMVMVTVQVNEVGPNGLSNICMVQVDVEDKIAPLLVCPGSTVINCTDDYSDLSVYGNPQVFENCGYVLQIDSSINLGVCGTGNIVRQFVATDDSGNSNTCLQNIQVVNSAPFDGSSIVWPLDYTDSVGCIPVGNLDPEDLPTGYNEPTFVNEACAMIATNYEDMLFDIDFPACYKLVRNWTVIDWCNYNPGNPAAGGKWEYQQLIKVMDTETPLITFCPPNQVVAIDGNCDFGELNVSPVQVTDCSSEIYVQHDSPYANASGADASGLYPSGTHTIVFDIEDGCGNQTSCSFTVEVRDLKPPTPYCSSGIIGELQNMNGQVMTSVSAIMLDEGSFDNCTNAQDLIFTIRALPPIPINTPPTTTHLMFDCSQIGTHQVEVWVTDAAGNSDYCTTEVIIQDNLVVCDDPNMGVIAGDIETEMGENVEEVTVNISGSNAFPNTTGFDGSFAFPSLPLGNSYTVTPEKDIHPLNGVTTWDLVLLTRHIIGTETLDSPFKIIAADINRSGTLTTIDAVELRRMILNIYDDFPTNESWRFVDKHHTFLDPTDPFAFPFPEEMSVTNLTNQGLDANFTGVKVGDLNDSAIPNTLLGIDDRSSYRDFTLQLQDQVTRVGEELVIPFQAKDLTQLVGCQFTIEFDSYALMFNDFEAGALNSLEESNFGFTRVNEGILTFSWFNLEGVTLQPEEVLFYLKFDIQSNIRLSEAIKINSRYTVAEAYDRAEETLNVELEFSTEMETQVASAFELYQNEPNPFKEMTTVSFSLPEAEHATLRVFDMAGKTLKTIDRFFEKGYHEFNIQREDLPVSGVLFYQLETTRHTATKKMILID